MRATAYRTFRVVESLADEAEQMSQLLGYGSSNRVIERCIEEVIGMCRAPRGARTVPLLVRLVDEARRTPERLPESASELNDRVSSTPTAQPGQVDVLTAAAAAAALATGTGSTGQATPSTATVPPAKCAGRSGRIYSSRSPRNPHSPQAS